VLSAVAAHFILASDNFDAANNLENILLIFLGTQYVTFLVAFVLDAINVRLMRPTIKEEISLLRNAIHYVLSPVVLLIYSCVEFAALFELAVRGKAACTHKASRKSNLM